MARMDAASSSAWREGHRPGGTATASMRTERSSIVRSPDYGGGSRLRKGGQVGTKLRAISSSTSGTGRA